MINLPSRFESIQKRHFTNEGERSLFFSRFWIYGAILLTAIGAILERFPIALVGLFVLGTAAGSALWNRYALNDIGFTVKTSAQRAFPGDVVLLEIALANEKPLPLPEITVNLAMSAALEPLELESTVEGATTIRTVTLRASLRPFERRTWTVPVTCTRRGPWSVGPAMLRSSDPFGFFSSRRIVADKHELIVYPISFPVLEPPQRNQRPLGQLTARRRLVTDPMRRAGVRDYHPEDPFRGINWKATARTGALKVNVNDPVISTELIIVLNLDTFTHYWEGLALEQSERAIETAASVVRWAIGQQMSVGLTTNGLLAGADSPLRIPLGRGLTQQEVIMTGLARLWAFSTVPVIQVLQQGRHRHHRETTFVFISPMTSPAILEQLRLYTLAGFDPLIIPVGEAVVPPTSGLHTWQITLPGQEQAA